LTKDKRYTLSPTSLAIKQTANRLSQNIHARRFTEFKRLQQETRQLLEEFQAYNSNIVEFVDPLEDEEHSGTI
jgi:hypothetical protein